MMASGNDGLGSEDFLPSVSDLDMLWLDESILSVVGEDGRARPWADPLLSPIEGDDEEDDDLFDDEDDDEEDLDDLDDIDEDDEDSFDDDLDEDEDEDEDEEGDDRERDEY